MEVLIGIDVGSTNVKCCIYSSKAELLFQSFRSTRNTYKSLETSYGIVEAFDGELLWKLICKVTQEAASFLNQNHQYTLKGISSTCIGGPAVCVDKNNKPVFPIRISSFPMPDLYHKYNESLGKDGYFKITGCIFDPLNSTFYLAHQRREKTDKYEKIKAILSVADYINLKLTNVISREYSSNVAMSFWDFRANNWWQDLLNEINIDIEKLGKPKWSGECVGTVTKTSSVETGLPEGIIVSSGGHDYLCASLASGCITPGSFINVIGTYELVVSFHDRPLNLEQKIKYVSFVDYHVVPDVYSLQFCTMGSGQLEWFRQCISSQNNNHEHLIDWDILFSEIETLPHSFKETQESFVPYVFGCEYLGTDAANRGGYIGITSNTNRATLLRAMIEGLSFQTKRMIQSQMETASLEDINQIIVVGGGSRSRMWMQIKANILNKPLFIPKIKEATALGAALLAGVGSGVYTDVNEAVDVAMEHGIDIVEPDPEESKFYSEIFEEVHLPLVKSVENINEKINFIVNSD